MNVLALLEERGYSQILPVHTRTLEPTFIASQGNRRVWIKLYRTRGQYPVHRALPRIVPQCVHPNIVRYLDMFTREPGFFVVSEYYASGTLFVYSMINALSEPELRRLFRKILLTLQFLHQQRIAHRGLTLHRILFKPNLVPVITRLSRAILVPPPPPPQVAVDEDEDDIVQPTPAGHPLQRQRPRQIEPPNLVTSSDLQPLDLKYSPPELVLQSMHDVSDLEYDPFKWDIWNIGLMLFAATNQAPPFEVNEHTVEMELYLDQINRDYRFSVNASDNLVELIRSCLDPVAENRPTIPRILAHPWFANP